MLYFYNIYGIIWFNLYFHEKAENTNIRNSVKFPKLDYQYLGIKMLVWEKAVTLRMHFSEIFVNQDMIRPEYPIAYALHQNTVK